MKFLYITSMYPSIELPQYCVFLHQQVKALIDNGVNITIVIPSTSKETKRIEYDGVDILYLHYRDFSRSFLYWIVSSQLMRAIRKTDCLKDYDIIYAIHASANILNFARILSRKMNRPLVVHYRGFNIFNEYEEGREPLFSNPEKIKERVVKESALSLGVSRKTIQIITDRFPDAPTKIVYNGVNAEKFSMRKQGNHGNIVKLLCVANLIPIKGHKYLFDAYASVCREHPKLNLQLDIVGRGYYEDELIKYATERELKNVVFHGYVSHKKVADFMREADMFVLPSVYDAFPNVCLEAMSSNVPIIIFDGQGIDEIIENGISGMVARKGDSDDLKNKLEEMIKNPELRKLISQNGNQVVKQYTWDKSAKDIIAAVNSVRCLYNAD